MTVPTAPPPAEAPDGGPEKIDAETRIDLYRTMVLARTFEEAMLREYHADKGPGFDIGKGLVPGEMHLAAGQEPVAAGVCAHLTTDDAVTATHRPHHFAIAHGVDLRRMAAEIFGRETGLGRGRGGHMHLFDPDTHFSCSGIIAEGYPPALGQAFAFQRQGTDRIAVAVTGEGAANQGAFHESLNLAALWKLPVVFIVEDNDWGISVPRAASTSVPSNAARAAAYDMPGERVEDNAVEAVYAAAGRAVARARAGDGPSLIEVHTLRLWGHFEGDAQGYRKDIEDVPGRDPLPTYERTLRDAGLLDDAAVEQIRSAAAARVEDAVTFAKESPAPIRPTPCAMYSPTEVPHDRHRGNSPADHGQGDGRRHRRRDGARRVGHLPRRGRRRVRRHLRLVDRSARPLRRDPGHRHADLRDRVHRAGDRRGRRGHAARSSS